jgi:two-component system, NarL family, invasion response regulator UvrY
MSDKDLIRVAVVDNHVLLRKGIARLIEDFNDLSHNHRFEVLFEAGSSKEMTRSLKETKEKPDIILLDNRLPDMDALEGTQWLRSHYPDIHVLVLSLDDSDATVIGILKGGARGYIVKTAEPKQLMYALESIFQTGFFYSNMVARTMLRLCEPLGERKPNPHLTLTEREIEFLNLVCTELTYQEIAVKMGLSARTIDGYRDSLFVKLNTRTRVGLALYAVRSGIVKLGDEFWTPDKDQQPANHSKKGILNKK